MAQSSANVVVGAAVASVSAYVTAAGAGTFTDLGHIKEKFVVGAKFEDYDIKSQNSFGILRKVPTGADFTIKLPLIEATADNYTLALRQPVANKSGTTPNFTVRVGQPTELYKQIQIVTAGLGSTGVKTILFWKCIVTSVDEIPFDKNSEQVLMLTMQVCWDDSVSTADKYFKFTES